MESSINFPDIPLTAIFVKDKDGDQSAFFAEFPEVMAQGSSQEDAFKNLFEIFRLMWLDKKKDTEKNISSSGFEYIEKPYNLVLR